MPEWTAKDAGDEKEDKNKYIQYNSALTCACVWGGKGGRLRVHVHALRPYTYVCIVDTGCHPESNGLGTSQSQKAPHSPILAPSSRRPQSMVGGCCFLHMQCWFVRRWGKGPFSSYRLPLYTAGSGRWQMRFLPLVLVSGNKLVSLGRCCHSS